MELTLEKILWLLVFIDSISTNLIVWFFPKWYEKKFNKMSKYFPATKGWSTWYLILVIWIGYAYKLSHLIFFLISIIILLPFI
jgi:hypothetical protein